MESLPFPGLVFNPIRRMGRKKDYSSSSSTLADTSLVNSSSSSSGCRTSVLRNTPSSSFPSPHHHHHHPSGMENLFQPWNFQPYIRSPSKSTRPSGPKDGMCRVCKGVKYQFHHYGSYVCNRCRAFFRRVVRKQRKGIQPNPCITTKGDLGIPLPVCDVSLFRGACQACRYITCLNVGMKPHLVLTDAMRSTRYSKVQNNNSPNVSTSKVKRTKVSTHQEIITERKPPTPSSKTLPNDTIMKSHLVRGKASFVIPATKPPPHLLKKKGSIYYDKEIINPPWLEYEEYINNNNKSCSPSFILPDTLKNDAIIGIAANFSVTAGIEENNETEEASIPVTEIILDEATPNALGDETFDPFESIQGYDGDELYVMKLLDDSPDLSPPPSVIDTEIRAVDFIDIKPQFDMLTDVVEEERPVSLHTPSFLDTSAVDSCSLSDTDEKSCLRILDGEI